MTALAFMIEKELAHPDHSEFPTLWTKIRDGNGYERYDDCWDSAVQHVEPLVTNHSILDIIML